MHLAFQLNDARLDDKLLSELALKKGILAPALSAHATGARANGWNGFLLGYAQVPAGQIDAQVQILARIVHKATRAG
jgi:GntR family transcriptional regulator/MocR family aminotransferase